MSHSLQENNNDNDDDDILLSADLIEHGLKLGDKLEHYISL